MERRQERRTLDQQRREIRSAEDSAGKHICGYFAVFGDVYELWPGATESIDSHAFDGCLEDDVRCLIDHDTRMVLGRTNSGTLALSVDKHGLAFDVTINEQDTDALNLYARVQRGDVSGCSFGFDILDEETEYRQDGSIHWTIQRVKLYEGSICTFPAYRGTEAEARKEDYQAIRRREVEAWKNSVKERLDKWR